MKKRIIYILASVILVGGILSYNYYQKIFGKAIIKKVVLFVTSTDDLLAIQKKIEGSSKNDGDLLWVAAIKDFSNPKSGRYVLKEGLSNNNLVNMLRSGSQTPFKLSFNNQDTLEKFAGRIASQIAVDSLSLLTAFRDEAFLEKNNLTTKSVLQIFIPNTYEFYWTVSPEDFRTKMLFSYHQFWNESRIQKAKKINLTKEEVIILASIIQKETAQTSERPIVAGLYLNRLKKNWPLQADPTIIYCVKEKRGQEFLVKRVLNVDLEINSPYNTYKYSGLPPTLISMPDISAIDGVLNAQKHNYYYMCASIEKLGYHAFSKSLSQHNRNATKYHQWMNKQQIHR